MPKQSQNISGLQLNMEKPTTFTFKQLFNWVIWQVPEPLEKALCGAVKPPTSDAKWYPAIIHVKEKKVHVYGHLETLFDSPEAASNYLHKMG